MALACCSGKLLVLAAESHSSGRLLRPYHLEPRTYFGGTAWETSGKKMGGLEGQAFKATSGHRYATEMPFKKVQIQTQSAFLTDRCTFILTENIWKNTGNSSQQLYYSL